MTEHVCESFQEFLQELLERKAHFRRVHDDPLRRCLGFSDYTADERVFVRLHDLKNARQDTDVLSDVCTKLGYNSPEDVLEMMRFVDKRKELLGS